MKNKTQKRGFTIVELVIVIAVIAILASILITTFSGVIKNAHESADKELIRNVNQAMAMEAAQLGLDRYDTMHDAVKAADEGGYNVPKIKTKSDNNIAWNRATGGFVLLDEKEGKYIYPIEDGKTATDQTEKKEDFFVVCNSKAEAEAKSDAGYSVYAGPNWPATDATVDLKTGFDAGYQTCIQTVNYANTNGEKDVVIRTNFKGTDLIVNAPNDTVRHFEEVGSVHVIAVDSTHCYEENGKAAFTQIDSGKYRTTETADVELIFVSNASSVTIETVKGTVDHAHAISEADATVLNDKATGVTFDYDGNNGQAGEGVQDHSTAETKLNLTENFTANKEVEAIKELTHVTYTLYVDGKGEIPGYYKTFAEAYDAAQSNDIIHFTAGRFVEAIAVREKPIIIEGEGIDKTFIVGPETYSTSTIPMLEWSGWSDDKYVYSLVSINADATIRNLSVMGDTDKVGLTNSNPLVDTPSNAFAGIHVQDANAVIENVNISNIMPTKVNGNSHHGFGLYITTTNSNNYNLTYKGGIVEKTCRGGIYCWTDKYTLNFEDIKVYGNGNKDNPNGRITLEDGAGAETYAYCGFYNSNTSYNGSSAVTYNNVEFIDVCNVWGWGGALWCNSSNPPAGVTFTNCH